jgi:hypothetical protein
MVFVVTENRLAVMAAVHDVVARLLGPLQATGQPRHRMGLRRVLRRSSAGTGRYFTANFICAKVLRRASPFSHFPALGSAAKGAKKLDKDIDREDAFLSELRDFEEKLRRAANLHLDPDLNDGVVLNIASLWELVPWKEAKSYWDDLMDGKYEWSSISEQLREKGLVK